MSNTIILNIELIKKRLTEVGKTQKEIAAELGISPPAVSKWFSSQALPEPKYLKRLCELLTLPISSVIQKKERFSFQFRLNKNKIKNDIDDNTANEIISVLSNLLPIIENKHKFFNNPLSLVKIENSDEYYHAVAEWIRELIGKLDINSILDFIQKSFNIIFVPVLWGDAKNFCNALEITDNNTKITFLFINLNSRTEDFKFWLLHEIFHILGFKDESSADFLAGEVLFSKSNALQLLENINGKDNTSQAKQIITYAKQLGISTYTIHKTLASIIKKTASNVNLVPYNKIAIINNNASVDYYLGEDEITAKEYFRKCKIEFNSNFFEYVAEYIKDNQDTTPHFVRKLLNIAMEDAVEIFKALKNG